MPAALTRGDRRLLLFAGAVLALLLAASALFAPSRGVEHPTTYSAASAGAKAAWLLLQQSGYRTERWERPVQELTEPAATTLILADPVETPNAADKAALAAFISRGGRVIATGDIGASFLSASVRRDPVGALTWKVIPAAAPSAITRAAPAITLAPANAWGWLAFGLPLYADQDVYVVRVPTGQGEAIWWASATPLTNAGLREPGNLEFFLACLGPPDGRRVLFDEYVHGHRRTLVASIWRSPAKWIGLQAAVLALVIVATASRRSGPILLPPDTSRLSPLEFVRTLGSLYGRAGVAPVAVDMAWQRFRQTIARRFGISPKAPVDEVMRALAGRVHAEPAALGDTLRRAEIARERHDLDPKDALALVQALNELERSSTSH